MLKTILRATIIFAFAAACKKEDPAPPPPPATTPVADTTKPIIVLNGNISDTSSLNSTYLEPGFTATDNVNGDITASVTIVGTVDKDYVGGNYIYYNVKDKAGNSAQAIRYVYVRNDAYTFAGNYNVVSNCGPGFTGLNSTTEVQTSNTVNNKLVFSNQQFQSPGFGVAVFVTGTSLTMYTQPVASSLASGTGTIAADGKSFTLTTTYSPPIQGSSGCTIEYTRQ